MNKKHCNVCAFFVFASLLTSLYCAAEQDFKDHFARANKLFKDGKNDAAIEYYNKTIAASPKSYQAYFNRGLAHAAKEDMIGAEQSYRKAIALNPRYTKAHFMLGKTLKKQGKVNEAMDHYKQVIKFDPTHFDAYSSQAKIYAENRQFDKAVEFFKQAIKIRPNSTLCKLDCANTLNMMNRTQQALELYKEIENMIPNSPSIIFNIAYTLKKLGRINEAFDYYYKVLELDPNHVEGHFGLGLSYIMVEDFERGWKEYEWRWKQPRNKARTFRQPRWDGSDLHGKSILLHAEQGLGDSFQFIRYAKVLKEMGATIIVASQNPLIDIFSECDYIDHAVPLNGSVLSFDFHLPLMSAPLVLGTRVDTIPIDIPYLYAKEKLVKEWKEKLANDTSFKIGICWQGNPNYSTQFLRNTVAAKSINLTEFAPICRIPGVKLYSLQKTTGEEQLNNVPNDFVIHEFGADFDKTNGRFMDTAAVMKNLDLVLTVDTSIVHLAGGLGVRTWMILPEPADWRWMMRKTDSPWYPGMRLFRQPKPDDWKSVIKTVTEELKKELKHRGNVTFVKAKTTHNAILAEDDNIPHDDITTEKLIKTIVQLETQASRTQNPKRLKQLRTELRQLRKRFNIVIKPSYELDLLVARLLEVNKKLWATKDALMSLDPDNDTFVRLAQNIVTLCSLRDALTAESIFIAHELQGE